MKNQINKSRAYLEKQTEILKSSENLKQFCCEKKEELQIINENLIISLNVKEKLLSEKNSILQKKTILINENFQKDLLPKNASEIIVLIEKFCDKF